MTDESTSIAKIVVQLDTEEAEKKLAELRAQVESLGKMPAFSKGEFSGFAFVGEDGPQIEDAACGEQGNADMLAELRSIRAEIVRLHEEMRALSKEIQAKNEQLLGLAKQRASL